MNVTIAIETSVPKASVSLSIEEEVIASETFESHRKQNQMLFPALQEILEKLRQSKLTPNQILVGTGPGSYSGSRISIAAAQGLAVVYQCPVAGICSFLATTTLAEHAKAVAIGDARRNAFFIADIHAGSPQFSPRLLDEDEFLSDLSKIDASVPRISFEPTLPSSDYVFVNPSAEGLMQAWSSLPQAEREALNAAPTQPLYLRAPFITKAKSGHPILRKQ